MPRASLLTIDDFALGTDKTDFFDSEAAGFMEVVSKITFREHIIVIKWVSPDLKNVNCQLHKMGAGLLSEKLDNLFNYVEKMQALSMLEKKISLDSKSFLEILKGWNFTATQTYQLRSLIRRWEAKKVRKNPIDEVKNLKNSREVIFILSQILEKHDIDWNEN